MGLLGFLQLVVIGFARAKGFFGLMVNRNE